VTQEAGNQSSKEEVKLLPVEQMEKMSHSELYLAREKAATPEEQKHIAPYEHRAFAREYVEENPITGSIGLAVAIPGYQAAKAIGAHGTRTGVQGKQIAEGYKGIGEGLVNAIKKPWERVWNDTPTTLPQQAPPGSQKPWEKYASVPLPPAVSEKPTAQTQKAPVSFKTEADVKAAVQLTPEEQARDERINRSPENIAELRREIANTKDPKNRQILQVELDKLTKGKTKDVIEEGNIDLNTRPVVKNKDGSISTVRSIGVNIDGTEVLIPTVSPDGRILSDEQAIALYRRTGKHLGKFSSVEASNRYAEKLHKDQEKQYTRK